MIFCKTFYRVFRGKANNGEREGSGWIGKKEAQENGEEEDKGTSCLSY